MPSNPVRKRRELLARTYGGHMAINVTSETLGKWSDFVRVATTEFGGKWHFRGALDSWGLEPSLQRTALDWDVPLKEVPTIERRLLRDFKRA